MLQLTDWEDAYKLRNHMNKEAAESQRLHTLGVIKIVYFH